MSTSITLNGVSYSIPATGEDNWGTNVSNYLIASSTGLLSKAGGAFTLTADVDFGANFGLKAAYYKSRATVSTAGVFRLGNAESIGWRNAANGANKLLKVNSSDLLEFDGSPIAVLGTGSITSSQLATALTDETGSGAVVFGTSPTIDTATLNSPTLVTPALGTPSSGTLTNATGLPISTGVSGLGSGVATFLATPSSANLISAITDETGTGSLVFANTPTLVTPILGTPTSVTLTNATGLPVSTGISGLGTGVATFLATPSSANLISAITDETGTGALVFANSPTLVTPALGTPSSVTLTNATGLPITGITGFATNVRSFLQSGSSSDLRAAVTDETGSGVVVFNNSPSFTTSVQLDAQAELRLADNDSSNYVGFKAASTVSANKIWTLPTADGSSGQVLKTDGSAVLSWVSVLSSPMTTTGDIIYSSDNSGTPARLGIGASGTVLKGGTTPSYASIVNADIDAAAAIAGSKLVAATNSVAGAVTTSAQSFAGVKTFYDGIVLDDAAGQSTLNSYISATSWTPTLFIGATSQSLTNAIGRYWRIGSIVYISGRVTISGVKSGTGAVQLRSLPFTSANISSSVRYMINVSGYSGITGLATKGTTFWGELGNNTSSVDMVYGTSGGANTNLQDSDLSGGSGAVDFNFTGWYTV